jgi:hypothetical protein
MAELQNWCNNNGMNADIYDYYTGKKYARRTSHNMKFVSFSAKEAADAAKIVNEYDIVMFMSYPNAKTDHDAIRAFYHDFFCKLTKPIICVYNLEIMKMNIDKIGYLGLIVNRADMLFHYGLDTWFSKTVDSLGMKKIGDRLHRFNLWMDFSNLDKFKEDNNTIKKNGLVSVTRWSSLKNIGRTIEIQGHLKKMVSDWNLCVHGVERSIGAKFDILNRPDVAYHNASGRIDGPGPIDVYGPCVNTDGLKLMSDNLFSSSFFSLPKTPWDYGNRHEYSQIENAYLSIPLFDTHWGENNKNKEDVRFCDIPYSAVYSNGKDTLEVANRLIEISNNPKEKARYLEVAAQTVKNEYDSNIVIPAALELILSKGKQANVLDDYSFNVKIVNEEFAHEISKLEAAGEIPVLGIDEYEKKMVYKLVDHKQELVKKIKTPKVVIPKEANVVVKKPSSKSLF